MSNLSDHQINQMVCDIAGRAMVGETPLDNDGACFRICNKFGIQLDFIDLPGEKEKLWFAIRARQKDWFSGYYNSPNMAVCMFLIDMKKYRLI